MGLQLNCEKKMGLCEHRNSRFAGKIKSCLGVLTVVFFIGCGGGESSNDTTRGEESATPVSNTVAVRNESTPLPVVQPPGDPVEMTQMRQSFSNADPGLKVFADEILAEIRTGSRQDAIEKLEKMSRMPSLTPDQRKVVETLLNWLKSSRR